jgi:hypothetical protein
VQPVDVLRGRYGFDDGLYVEPGRKRELHQDAVHARVAPESVHQIEELPLRDGGREAMAERRDADLAARAFLATDVHMRGGIVADEDGGEPGCRPTFGQPGHAFPDLAPHRRRRCLTVDRPSHARFPTFRLLYRWDPGRASTPSDDEWLNNAARVVECRA